MKNNKRLFERTVRRQRSRRGIIIILTSFLLTVLFAFLALSVDTGRVVLTETRMQNAVDAAALAASQEIEAAVYSAGQGQGSVTIDANSVAIAHARTMAAQVAQANGVYVNADSDVKFGRRVYNPSSGQWSIEWGSSPFSVVQVKARRTGSDISAPDGKFPLAFGWSIGKESVPLETSATAFVEARDLVLVLDFSASMNDDSSLGSSLGSTEANKALDAMWNSLVTANPKWPGTTTPKFPSTGFGSINSYAGTYVASTTNSTIMSTLGLTTNVGSVRKYPFPQAGRNADGSPKAKPSNSTSDSLWTGYINYVKGLSGTYKQKYGYRTLMSYLQDQAFDRSVSEDLWRTPHYPTQALKDGASLFCNFLKDLNINDELGLVVYGQWAVQQKTFYDGEADVNITADPITPTYSLVDTIQKHLQAGEYEGWTAMGDGILKGRELLLGVASNPNDHGFARYGAQPTLIVMTDGQTNQKPSGWTMPAGFSWAQWTDYNGDGTADYSTTDVNKKYAFWEATEAIKRGVTIHTISVGAGADRDLMKAIAFAGRGLHVDVPGGSTVADMHDQMLSAFAQIAAKLPPAQLIHD
ncbi:MAG: vWA domain-containing protein [Pirellulales bacterium]